MARADSPFTVDVGLAAEQVAAEQVLEQRALLAAAAEVDDDTLLMLAPKARRWVAGEYYAFKELVATEGQLYQVDAPDGVTAQAHQSPGSTGMLAVYRPIDTSHKGTKKDPIPAKEGLEYKKGKHYSENGVIYLCTRSDVLYYLPSALVGYYFEIAG